jgi:opacity protein-like surface antigen
MKKQLCSLAVLSFITLSALNAGAQMTIGGRVGLDIGSLSYSPGLPSGNSTSYHTGFLVGAQMDDWFNDMWAISVQLLYDQKGSYINVNGSSALDEEALSYLEIPILAKVALGSGDVKPYLFAGPSIGIQLSATRTYDNVSSTSMSDDTDYNKIDLAVLVGAGVSYKLAGGSSLFLDAGYAIGLINIAKNNAYNTSASGASETVKTNDIRIAAGILFPLN